MYEIKTIHSKNDILSCNKFEINHFNWSADYKPYSYGYVGLLENKGLLVRLCCEEENPLCTYTEPNSMVYKDSAMEAFFQINPELNKGYINLELNSAGVLRAQFGETRDERTFFTEEQMKQCEIRCDKETLPTSHKSHTQNMWWVEILLPFSIIDYFYGDGSAEELKNGSTLRCNFFKLSESPEIEHYASYSPIDYPTPNFHMPEFFADAVVRE